MTALILALLAMPFAAEAQRAPKVYQIGVLVAPERRVIQPYINEFEEALRDLGYVNGKNVQLEYRFAEGNMALLPELAKDLVRSQADIIVVGSNPGIVAAKAATQSTPVVMIIGTSVVESGFVASLAKPGGNITGLTWDVGVEMEAKRLQLLKEAAPSVSRVAVVWDPRYPELPGSREAIERAAKALKVSLVWIEFTDNVESIFRTLTRERADALFVTVGPRIFQHKAEFAHLALKHRIPSAYWDAAFVDVGGLMSYAPNLASLYRGSAKYIDRILNGARPADLPVERPSKVELVFNLKTARTLGLTMQPSMRLLADRVIE